MKWLLLEILLLVFGPTMGISASIYNILVHVGASPSGLLFTHCFAGVFCFAAMTYKPIRS